MCAGGGGGGGEVKNQAGRGRDERQAVCGEDGGEAREVRKDGWSAVGGKRGKPQRNKRPSGLIRRQIGWRAQWGERERVRDV